MTRRGWTVAGSDGGRLDVHVARALDLSRSRAAALIASGRVLVDGRTPRKSDPVVPGQRIEARIPQPKAAAARPQNIPVRIAYQDDQVVVVDKQPGLVAHPAPGHPDGTLVNALLHHVRDLSSIGGVLRPGIVHRLDKDTSGLLVVAKTDLAHRVLAEALKARQVARTYLTALWGQLPESPMEVDKPVGRHARDRMRMAVVADGRPARTRFRAIERWRAASLCEARLETGRTHQIRVHAAAIGHPVVGDALYGAGRERGFWGDGRRWAAALAQRVPRQFLHAHRLEFEHPATGAAMAFESPLPEDLAAARAWALGVAPT